MVGLRERRVDARALYWDTKQMQSYIHARALAYVKDAISESGFQIYDLENCTSFARWCLTQYYGFERLPFHSGLPYSDGVWEHVKELLETEMQSWDLAEIVSNETYVPYAYNNHFADTSNNCAYCNLPLDMSDSNTITNDCGLLDNRQHVFHTECASKMRQLRCTHCPACLNTLSFLETSIDYANVRKDWGFNLMMKAVVDILSGGTTLRTATSRGPLAFLCMLLASFAACYVNVGKTVQEYESLYEKRFSIVADMMVYGAGKSD
jgi:hypothetical protein